MATDAFEEGQSYEVRELHLLDPHGTPWLLQDVTAVFTTGWVLVHEGDEDFIVPRELVRLAKGVQRATVEPWWVFRG